MHARSESRPQAEIRLIDISGLLGCAGVLLLQWAIVFPLVGEKLYGQVWPPLAVFTGFLARLLAGAGSEDAVAVMWLHIHFAIWTLHILGFAAAYWILVCSRKKLAPRMVFVLLIVQLALSLSAGDVLPKIFAMELPLLFPMKRALKWLAAGWLLAALGNVPYVYFSPDGPSYIAFVRVYVDFINATALDVTFFAFGLLAAKEKRGRLELEQAHAELAGTHADLLAAQMLLSEKVRTSERVRIARRLHDAIDHHLSEQNRHLELAMREADADSLPSITTARDLSVTLLKEIRQVVDTGMADNSINLRQALETLCSGIPSPRIVLSFEESLDVRAPSLANAIFRCVQEAVSNTIRHAQATTLRISLERKDGGIAIEIIDDGIGAGMSEGSGLAGIRERVEALDGRIAKNNRPEGGFELDIWLPFAEGAR